MLEGEARRKHLHRQWMKLFAAALLLDVIIVLGMLFSSPLVSPSHALWTNIYKTAYGVRPVKGADLTALHDKAASVSSEQCIACHGTMIGSSFLLHRIHLQNELLPGLACHDCHKTISLERRSNTHVVKMVDVAFCKKCHSAFPGLDPKSPMKPDDFKADCTTCHSGKHSFKHGQPYLSQVVAPRECAGCHGGRVLPWTPDHERSDWLQVHGTDALRVGSKTCMACHEFGLSFCNDCHKTKPPSHLPRADWLTAHPAAAQADTRACFTCHQAADCKKCHVNHTPDWLKQHPATVKASGSDSCGKCHSASFCGDCHTSGSASATGTATP
jgi:hypothetical protein